MKLVCFRAIELFFAAEFIYENSFHLCVLHFRLFHIYSIKILKKKNFTIIIPTVIDCAIMKCGGCENRSKTKPTKYNQTLPNLSQFNLT